MPDHDELIGYDDNDAATAAAHTQSGGRIPYRVWHCSYCGKWHAAPWTCQDPGYASQWW